MFTGIVQGLAKVSSIKLAPSLMQYSLLFPKSLLNLLAVGASVSVQGICQTVVNINWTTDEVFFDAIEETLKQTTLRDLHINDWVNIERSAKIGDEIGGHLMSGHIIGTATIEDCQSFSEQLTLSIRCTRDWMKYILPKGFIGINGASLTVGKTHSEGKFLVHLIPETLRQTTFGKIAVGDRVNIEISNQTQVIVDTVENILGKSGGYYPHEISSCRVGKA